MTDLHTQLLARTDPAWYGLHGSRLPVFAALRAVVDRHGPFRRRVTVWDDEGSTSRSDLGCLQCTPNDVRVEYSADIWWPCPTIRTAAQHLGIDSTPEAPHG